MHKGKFSLDFHNLRKSYTKNKSSCKDKKNLWEFCVYTVASMDQNCIYHCKQQQKTKTVPESLNRDKGYKYQ